MPSLRRAARRSLSLVPIKSPWSWTLRRANGIANMRPLFRFSLPTLCLLLIAATAGAQTLTPVNAASYVNPALPNGSIAQGSMFVAFGSGLGPASIEYPNPWPFPTELAGTTIEVTVGSTTKDCFVVYTSAGQIAGILPSDTPIGTGTMTVRYNGAVAGTGPVKVVASSFGIFTINQQGLGPAVATDPLANSAVYTTTNSAAPGNSSFIDIWGTGLGASLDGNDDGKPKTGNIGADAVKVYVANQEQEVLYAGRSGCCSSIDQIRIKTPDMSGCFLPLVVVVNGVSSNFATVSIDPSGADCTPDPIFGGPDLSQLQNGDTYNAGVIALSRGRSSLDFGAFGPAQSLDTVIDSASAFYEKVTVANVAAFAGNLGVTTIGSCNVYRYVGDEATIPDLNPAAPLDAGAQLSITGPGGDETIPKTSLGLYSKSFGLPSFPFLTPEAKQQFTPDTYYEPGLTTVTAPGGADVGAHSASLVVPQDFQWLNQPAASAAIDRSAGLKIEYTASGYDYVSIIGGSSTTVGSNTVGAQFYCSASPSASSFTVPAAVLLSLPASDLIEGFASGALIVGGGVYDTFTAPSLDIGTITYADTTFVTVDFN